MPQRRTNKVKEFKYLAKMRQVVRLAFSWIEDTELLGSEQHNISTPTEDDNGKRKEE